MSKNTGGSGVSGSRASVQGVGRVGARPAWNGSGRGRSAGADEVRSAGHEGGFDRGSIRGASGGGNVGGSGGNKNGRGGKKGPLRFGFWRWFKVMFMLGVAGVLLAIASVYGVFVYYARDLPDFRNIHNYRDNLTTYLYSREGILLNSYAIERRKFTDIGEIPRGIQDAFIAAEDREFYDHSGVDIPGIVRALFEDIKYLVTGKGSLVGASTITQQVVKNVLLTNEKTISRKIKEMILATRLTKEVSKDKVLEIYLNHIYFGDGAYGIRVAAEDYFGKSLDKVTVSEAALLAALPKAPSELNPRRNPEKALARRNWVLLQMRKGGYISNDEFQVYVMESIVLAPKRSTQLSGGSGYSVFTSHVKSQVSRKYGSDMVFSGGLHVYTTLDLDLQVMLFRAFRSNVLRYTRRYPYEIIHRIELEDFAGDWCAAFTGRHSDLEWREDFRLKRALIIKRDAKSITVGLTDCSVHELPFSGMSWVKLPEGVESVAQLFNVGDVVSVEKKGFSFLDSYKYSPIGLSVKESNALQEIEDDNFLLKTRGLMLKAVNVDSGDDLSWVTDGVSEEMGLGGLSAEVGSSDVEEKVEYVLQAWPTVNGGAIVIDPENGEVLALVGDFYDSPYGFNRAASANRQLGSTVKPFLYSVALENGYSPVSTLLDETIRFDDWKPKNHSEKYSGAITLRRAVERSKNLPTVRLAESFGSLKIIEALQRFNLMTAKDFDPSDLSIALGSFETTVERLAMGYATFANGGRLEVPKYILKIQDSGGEVIYQNGVVCEECSDASHILYSQTDEGVQIISPDVAYQIIHILEGGVRQGTSRRARHIAGSGVAGKTGTTNDSKDSWFAGVTPSLVFASYVGFDAPRPLGRHEYGATISLPIFVNFLESAKGKYPIENFPIPEGINFIDVDYDTGFLPSFKTKRIISEAFKPEDAPPKELSADIEDAITAEQGGGGEVGRKDGSSEEGSSVGEDLPSSEEVDLGEVVLDKKKPDSEEGGLSERGGNSTIDFYSIVY